MNVKDPIRYLLNTNSMMLQQYISDLSDEDLLARPAPKANHIAWQLGHLIGAEVVTFLPGIPGAQPPTLPEGFVERHSKEAASVDPPTGFSARDEYVRLHQEARAATLAALDKISETDLDADPGLGFGDLAPTVASVFVFIANHDMMHAGQFTVVRRMLGKPVLF